MPATKENEVLTDFTLYTAGKSILVNIREAWTQGVLTETQRDAAQKFLLRNLTTMSGFLRIILSDNYEAGDAISVRNNASGLTLTIVNRGDGRFTLTADGSIAESTYDLVGDQCTGAPRIAAMRNLKEAWLNQPHG